MRKKTGKMEVSGDNEKMIERLRKTKAAADAADAQRGERDGRKWAMRTASYRDLRALEAVADGYLSPAQLVDEPGNGLSETLADDLAKALNKLFGSEMMWDDVSTNLFPSPGAGYSKHYIVGFVASALEAWTEVKSKVPA